MSNDTEKRPTAETVGEKGKAPDNDKQPEPGQKTGDTRRPTTGHPSDKR